MINVMHISDVHYCNKYLSQVDKCMEFALEYPEKVDLCIFSGDLYDHSVKLHDECVAKCIAAVLEISRAVPVVILQGTFSHDVPGSLDVFKSMRDTVNSIHVIDQIETITVATRKGDVAITGLPPIHKGQVAATFGVDNVDSMAGEQVHKLLTCFSVDNQKYKNYGIPTILVGHGTVNGCLTEKDVPMHGNDWELSLASLHAANFDAVMLGHIHKQQVWYENNCAVAYAGSLACLHHGEKGDKGFLIWEIESGQSSVEFVKTPTTPRIDLVFDSVPDMDQIKEAAKKSEGAKVRIKYEIPEDKIAEVDIDAIKKAFDNADELKIESQINHKSRVRASGISNKDGLPEKLKMWCEQTGNIDVYDRILSRSNLLECGDINEIIAKIGVMV